MNRVPARRRSAGLAGGLLAVALTGCANPYGTEFQPYTIPVQPAFFGPAPAAPAAVTPGPFYPTANGASRAVPAPEPQPDAPWETPPALLLPPPDATAAGTAPDNGTNDPARSPAAGAAPDIAPMAAPAPVAPDASGAVPLMGFRPMRGQKSQGP